MQVDVPEIPSALWRQFATDPHWLDPVSLAQLEQVPSEEPSSRSLDRDLGAGRHDEAGHVWATIVDVDGLNGSPV